MTDNNSHNSLSFILKFEDGLDAKYKQWAQEAVEDFAALFPEFKNNFKITKQSPRFSEEIINLLRKKNEEILRIYNAEHPDNPIPFDGEKFCQMFEPAADGKYEISLEKQLSHATDQQGYVDMQKLLRSQRAEVGFCESPQMYPFVQIAVFSGCGQGNVRGISGRHHIAVAAGTCDLVTKGMSKDECKRYFKEIIMHELGHSFDATHKERTDCVDNLGWHDTDPSCLMYEYAYTREAFARRKNKKNPFCNHCMESMRQNMRETWRLQDRPLQVLDDEKELPQKPVDLQQRREWRTFARQLAAKMQADYEEDTKSSIFCATIKQKDGTCTKISAVDDNISLSAKDKEGHKIVPEQQVFKALVEKARKNGQTINFGNIKTPEFKARLLIACMEATPPMNPTNAPELNNEFYDSLGADSMSARRLKLLQRKTTAQNSSQTISEAQTATPKTAQRTPKNLTVRRERGR